MTKSAFPLQTLTLEEWHHVALTTPPNSPLAKYALDEVSFFLYGDEESSELHE